MALPHTDDIGAVLHDFFYHFCDVWGSSRWGEAPRRVALCYRKALVARCADDNAAARR